jgi:hypothetical protein
MANVIGEPLESYVINQVNSRQILHGSGVRDINRTEYQINLLNSKTAWVKLASGISVDGGRLKDLGLDYDYQPGMDLAKNNILYAGLSKLGISLRKKSQIQQRQGFLPRDPNSSYTYGGYGYSPMPGIISADVKALNRGSIKKSTVRLIANNKSQFDIIDLLYLRLGYTVLLEWGHSMYTNNGFDRETVRDTLIEETFFEKSGNGSYLDMLQPVEQMRAKYSGNYDALLGKVSNFSWSFEEDGSYSIEITIISLGDVVESLKNNISIDKGTIDFLNNTTGTPPASDPNAEPTEPDPVEENKDANTITAMLYLWKFLNINPASIPDDITISTPKPETYQVGGFLSNTQGSTSSTITSKSYDVEYTVTFSVEQDEEVQTISPSGVPITSTVTRYPFYKVTSQEKVIVVQGTKERSKGDGECSRTFTQDEYNRKQLSEHKLFLEKKYRDKYKPEMIKVTWKIKNKGSANTVTINNPLESAGSKDAFALKTIPSTQYYLRFGYLLEYVRDNIIPKIKTGGTDNPPMFDIDFGDWDNHMYSLPNQISLDPRVCIVRNDNFKTEQPKNTSIFHELDLFREIDNSVSTNENAAYVMNIYLNFNFIIECLQINERGDVNVFDFLKSICDGLNKALGGINNLEPIVEETSNTLKIIDTTPIPGYSGRTGSKPYTLQLFGYEKTPAGYISNFIRKVDLKTAITPEFATMITIGATAGGYVKGTEATAFSRWNAGLTDRFKESFEPGNPASVTPPGGVDEAESNYQEKIISANGYAKRYGFTTLNKGYIKLSDDIIEGNLSIGTEYFKYIIAKNQNTSGGTIGFIPFKISFTMDGLSGIKIYNKLNVDTRFLPKAYGDNLDLIVTGVSHKLANNDWETDIEATVIPKTTGTTSYTPTTPQQQQQQPQSGSAPGGTPPSFVDCAMIPPLPPLDSPPFGLVQASTTDYVELLKIVIENQEGTYYHPLHAIDVNTNKYIKGYSKMHISGETLWGIDRPNGAAESSTDGLYFWKEVDKISGFGAYGNIKSGNTYSFSGNKETGITKAWRQWRQDNKKKGTLQKANAWSYNTSRANPTNNPTLFKFASEKFLIPDIKYYINLYFNQSRSPNAQTVKNLVLTDGRLLYMHVRSFYSGIGNMQDDINSIIKIYDSGVRDIETLACKELGARWSRRGNKSHQQIKILIGLK